MQTIPLDKIKIPENRQRQEFDDAAFTELIRSIRSETGLLHPIVLSSADNSLIAGERRLRAFRLLHLSGAELKHNGSTIPPGHIPFVYANAQNPTAVYQTELDENLVRSDLTWQERARALAHLAEIRQAIEPLEEAELAKTLAKEALPNLEPNGAGRTVRQSLQVAKHLDNPAVAKAANLGEAFKLVAAISARAENAARASGVTSLLSANRHALIQGDCLEELPKLTGPFDILLTDPPYGMDADAFGDAAGKLTGLTHNYNDGEAHAISLIRGMLQAANPIMAQASHLYMYCDIDLFPTLRELVTQFGWHPHRTPLIHLKRIGGRVPWPEHGPRRAYELVLYAIKGKKPVQSIVPDVFDTSLTEGNLGHGAQKPVEGFVNLLSRSARPGDRVLDPFGGTGTTLAAAHSLNLFSTVIEKDPGAFGIAMKRLEELK